VSFLWVASSTRSKNSTLCPAWLTLCPAWLTLTCPCCLFLASLALVIPTTIG